MFKHGEDGREWACGKCAKIRELSEWTIQILELRTLQKAGYPFRANDLTLEEWQDIGEVNELIEQIEKDQMMKMRMF